MNARRHTAGLAVISLTLLLAACGGGTVDPLPVGTPVTSTADSGVGSLRDLLGSAKDGDTLRLASGTVTLAGPLKVTRNVTLDLGSGVIDAAGKGRALEIPSGVTVIIKGGTLKGGTGSPITVQSIGSQALSVATYGGILVNEGTLTLDGTAITSGMANLGGGIANLKTGTLTLKGLSSVTSNTAQALPADATDDNGAGGGIFNSGTLNIENGTVGSNSAVYVGGGVYNAAPGNMTISGGVLSGNTCTYTVVGKPNVGCEGGAIYTTGPITMSGGTVRDNTSTQFGGGIEAVNTTFNLLGGEISANTTFRAGGGVLLGQGTTLNYSGGTIRDNKATDLVDSGGGGILAFKATLKMSGGTIKGNSARFGGGIDAFTNDTVVISGGTIEGNATIENGNGGGINVNTGSTLNFTGGTIQNNTSAKDGGGIAISDSAGVLTISGTAKVSGNSAKQQGGGVYISRAKMMLAGGSIIGNTAVRTAGGVLDDGTVTMTGGEISGNTVTGRGDGEGGGGGVTMYASSVFAASGGSIKDNTAWYGGGVFIGSAYQTSPAGNFTLAGATVSGNKATDTNVGGGFFNDGQLTINSGSVTGNTAPRNGGGVFNSKVAIYAQPGGSVTGNTPDNVFNDR